MHLRTVQYGIARMCNKHVRNIKHITWSDRQTRMILRPPPRPCWRRRWERQTALQPPCLKQRRRIANIISCEICWNIHTQKSLLTEAITDPEVLKVWPIVWHLFTSSRHVIIIYIDLIKQISGTLWKR